MFVVKQPVIIAIASSSRSSVITKLEYCKNTYLSSDTWLPITNRYINNIATKFDEDILNDSINDDEVSEYIAVSTILHCFDGWNFLTRGIESIINGDIPTAIHLTYYAEVRAIMSLMASEGIGVFRSRHAFVDAAGAIKRIPSNGEKIQTHTFIHNSIIQWGKTKNIILTFLKVHNISIQDWISFTPYTGPADWLTKEWLGEWSMDLEMVNEDHNLRNLVSYNPNQIINDLYKSDYKENVKKIISFWGLCEPSATDKFSNLDSHLLRIALDKIYLNTHGRAALKTIHHEAFIDTTMRNAGITSAHLKDFLLRNKDPLDCSLLIEAKKSCYSPSLNNYDVLPMIARAILLLRISTGSCEELIKKSTISKEDLHFWWNKIGVDLAFWKDGDEPENLSDLWLDINESIDSINELIQEADFSVHTMNVENNLGSDLFKFKQFNRACLWGLGI